MYGNFVEMLDYLKVDEKIRPIYYASFEVNVYGGFVFILHLFLFEKHTHTHAHIYISGRGDESGGYIHTPTPKLHAAISVTRQGINPFSISHLTEVG